MGIETVGLKTSDDIIHVCCRCGERKLCEEHKDVVGGDDWNWWCKECFVIAQLTKVERSIFLYLETCLVDQYGRVEARKMNTDDLEVIDRFVKRGWIEFGRIKYHAMEEMRYGPASKVYTHWVRFSDMIWKVVHQLRKERADRILERNKERLEAEMTRNR